MLTNSKASFSEKNSVNQISSNKPLQLLRFYYSIVQYINVKIA